jgi:hypothetical protein
MEKHWCLGLEREWKKRLWKCQGTEKMVDESAMEKHYKNIRTGKTMRIFFCDWKSGAFSLSGKVFEENLVK